jgi:hypothetical protein
MVNLGSHAPRRIAGYSFLVACLAVVTAIAVIVATQSVAGAATAVNLGTAGTFGVLGGQSVTNTGPSVINGDLGVSPGGAPPLVTGFPPGLVNGTIHTADAVALQAQSDLTTAYNTAASAASTENIGAALMGATTLGPGVYTASSALDVGGTLTLDAHGDANAVWIFQVGSALTVDSGTSILLTDGAQACNVFWQVTSSATLGTGSTFVGSILALTSITVTTDDTIMGRALARNGSTTLDTDTITVPACASPTISPTPPTPTPTPTRRRPTPTPSPTRTGPLPSPSPSRSGPLPSPSPTRTGPLPSPSPSRSGPLPSPSPTRTGPRPSPSPTRTGPSPKPTRPAPKPSPTSPAPVPTPVPTTIPVTG